MICSKYSPLLLLTSVVLVSAEFPPSGNVYEAPSKSDIRSPCPAINLLANHGFIDRDGEAIPTVDIVEQLSAVFPVAESFSQARVDAARELGLLDETEDGIEILRLDRLFEHNKLEHDSSFVRQDVGLDEEGSKVVSPELVRDLFDKTAPNSDYLTKKDIMVYQRNRIFDTRMHTPDYSFSEGARTAMATQAARLIAMGQMSDFSRVSKQVLRDFLEKEMLSEDYNPDTFHHEPLTFEDGTKGGDLRDMFRFNIDEAIAQPLLFVKILRFAPLRLFAQIWGFSFRW